MARPVASVKNVLGGTFRLLISSKRKAMRGARLTRRNMSFLKKLLGRKQEYEPGKRVRVCVECGMPVEDHKEWCAIYREQRRRDEAASSA